MFSVCLLTGGGGCPCISRFCHQMSSKSEVTGGPWSGAKSGGDGRGPSLVAVGVPCPRSGVGVPCPRSFSLKKLKSRRKQN